MTLLLDTSILIALERGNNEVQSRLDVLQGAHPQSPRISFMTHVEFLYGIEALPLEKKAKAREFLLNFDVLHATNATAVLLSGLKHKYDRLGKQKSLTDLFIASQALEHNLTLITQDKDFNDLEEVQKIIV